MAQHDYDIANQSFPSFRADLNGVLEAVNTSNSGTSRPTSAVAGTVWLDVTNATNPTLKFFDGTDDISLAQFDYSANTVNWLDSTVATDLVNDTTPQLGGDLDLNSSDITGTGNVNITGSVTATSFSGDGSALTGLPSGDVVDDTTPQLGGNLDVNGNSIVSVSNGNISITPDGTGKVIIDGLSHPTADGTNGQALVTDGSGNLSFGDVSVSLSAVGESIIPSTTDTYDLGSSSFVWRNIYTGDLHLSNEAKSEGNSVDGTKGNWTIQEGAEDLFIVNNKSGKKYKFKLEEI